MDAEALRNSHGLGLWRKINAQGDETSWNGYKLPLDTADCGVPIAALLSSASMHDSCAVLPLTLVSDQRVTNLYFHF